MEGTVHAPLVTRGLVEGGELPPSVKLARKAKAVVVSTNTQARGGGEEEEEESPITPCDTFTRRESTVSLYAIIGVVGCSPMTEQHP